MLLLLLLFNDVCTILILLNVILLTLMPLNCRLLCERKLLSMDMLVIQPCILVSLLKKTKTRFLRCTDYLNFIKTIKQDLLLILVLVQQRTF